MSTRSDLVAVLLGVGFGVVVRLGDGMTGMPVWLVNISGPWLVLATAVGASATSVRAGVVRAGLCLLAAVLAKYAVQLVQAEIGVTTAAVRVVAWGLGAVIVAAVFGAVGVELRRGRSGWAVLLGLALTIEPLAFLGGGLSGESAHLRYHHQPPATAVFVAELCVGVALAVWAVCSPSPARDGPKLNRRV
jgi:hypothetical protein